MPKLSDTQLLVLNNAAQRGDHVAVLSGNLKGGAAAKVVKPLLAKGLLKEVQAKPDMPAWRRDGKEGRSYALLITRAGGKAINVELDTGSGTGPGEKAGENPVKPPASSARKHLAEPTRDATPREGSKLALVIGLLGAKGGATLDGLVKATGWQPHTIRAALTGLRKRGYELERKRQDGETTYRITAVPGSQAPAARKRRKAA
jgi:hypothetical protein